MAAILLIFLMAMEQGKPLRQPTATLSVCDVLASDPTRLNGKVIRVRGLLAATDEGTWLIDKCKTHLVTKGLEWGNSLSIYVDASDEAIYRSWAKIGEKLKRLHVQQGRDDVWITVTGQLETRASMDDEVVQMPFGLAKLGFGHMGGSPAEINVISVDDVTIPSPSSDRRRK